MTWRELVQAITSLPREMHDMEATVWIPDDYEKPAGEFIGIIGLSAFDGEKPYGEDNPASINLDEV